MNDEKTLYKNERLYYSLTYEDLVKIFNMLDNHDYSNLNIEIGDLKFLAEKKENAYLKNNNVSSPLTSPNQENGDSEQKESMVSELELETNNEQNTNEFKSDNEANSLYEGDLIPVEASISGTFYKAPSPNEESFVKVGSKVNKGEELGLIEVMKLFNSINAPCDGIIKEIHVEDQGVVSTKDVLMMIDPL